MADEPNKQLSKISTALGYVKVCRDFYLGAVKVLTREYLPLWEGETMEAYALRMASTVFPNLYAPIVGGIAGLVTKKEPTLHNIDKFERENVDLRGSNLVSFIKEVCTSSIVAGIEFVAAESSDNLDTVYFKRYSYESLYSYAIEDDKLAQIVFKDKLEKQKDRFGMETVERYIVFSVGGGEVWFDNGNGMAKQTEWANTLDEIPVAAIKTGKELTRYEIVPRLYDIALMNKVSLNMESQLANVLSVVGNPVPVFYGKVGDDGVKIGVKDALQFQDKQTEGFEYIEIDGGGVSKIQEKLKSVNETIDKLGFGLLEKTGSRTVIDAQDNQSKSTSFLTDVATELESAFNKLLRWQGELANKKLPEDARIEFKKDFDDVLFSDAQLALLHDLVREGNLSRETLWNKLKVANILPKEFEPEAEKEQIETII